VPSIARLAWRIAEGSERSAVEIIALIRRWKRGQMNEGLEQFLATIIEQCLGEYEMQPPLVIRTIDDNGSVLVARINEASELVVLSKQCENDTFILPIKVTIVGQNNRTARLVFERDGNIGRFH
jgi:hypothetical protein